MSNIISGRYAAKLEGEFVVFLIGARVNNLWAVHRWWPVAAAMTRMIRELSAHPELGYLGGESYAGRTSLMLQYWRSLDQLMSYAHGKNAEHLPAWRDYNQKIRASGAVGIWHETYVVKPGGYENIYGNMPAFGLGRVAQKVGSYYAVDKRRDGAAQRLTETA
jgi:Domain of unknown function (DUF4188)